MKHTLLKHENCTNLQCNICEGGLALCTTCGGAEGSLPKECPGRQMTEQEEADVYAGKLNFVDGKWTKK